MLDGTKSYFRNDLSGIFRSTPEWFDLGYSLPIPWNMVYQTGWIDAKPGHADGPVWGEERKLVTRPDPEFYASDNLIRSNVIPVINIRDPIYSFSREKHTFTV